MPNFTPTVSRRAWYFNGRGVYAGPSAATITQVDADGRVNLLVALASGRQEPKVRLPVLQEGDDVPSLYDFCCRPGLESIDVPVPEVPEVPAVDGKPAIPAVPATTKRVLAPIDDFESDRPGAERERLNSSGIVKLLEKVRELEERINKLESVPLTAGSDGADTLGDMANTTTQGASDAGA